MSWQPFHLNQHMTHTLPHYETQHQQSVNNIWSCILGNQGFVHINHQQKIFPSGQNGSVRVDTLRQRRQRHPGGGLLPARHQYHASCCISPSDRCFTVSSCSVGLVLSTNALPLWPTVTICRNGFIGYVLASGLQCDG